MASTRGMIAVDKMGTKVLFLNPVTYQTEVVLDGFEKTVHELLVIPETAAPMCRSSATASTAAIPIRSIRFACSIWRSARSFANIDLRPYIAPHTLKLGPDGLIYITCENSAVVVGHRPQNQQGGRRDRFRLDQRPPADHRAGRPAALHRERGGRDRLGDRSAEPEAARQDQDAAAARRHRHLARRPHRGGGRRRGARAVPDRHRSGRSPRGGAARRMCPRPRRSPAMRPTTA